MTFSRFALGALVAATVSLAACSKDDATAPTEEVSTDFSLVMFGEPGQALAGTMGTMGTGPAFDGRSGAPELPPDLRLTAEQRAQIEALRTAFRAANQADLDALRAVFEQARTARQGGATREEVRAILEAGRPTAERLRTAVRALHEAINGVLTAEQRAWLRQHRPDMPQGLPGMRR